MQKLIQRFVKSHDSKFFGYLALATGTICISLSAIIIKNNNAPTIVSSFYRMLLTAIFWTGYLAVEAIRSPQNNSITQATPELKWIFLPALAGLFSSLDHGLWALALNETSAANASILNNMAPLWISLSALIFLREKFKTEFCLGLLLSLIGMVFISGKGTDFFREGFNHGDLIAFGSSLPYCAYFLLTQLGRDRFSVLFQTWVSICFCAFGLAIFCKVMEYPLTGYDAQVWKNFIIVALLCQIMGHFLITYSLGCLPASVVGPTTQMHSVICAIAAVPLLGEPLSSAKLIGCLMIILGVLLVNRAKIK